jgi:uncharacterized membrane protein
MIYLPVSLLLFLVLLLLLPFLWFVVAVDVVEIAVAKLGFSPSIAILLFTLVILTSTINIPLYRTQSYVAVANNFVDWSRKFWSIPFPRLQRSTVVALNVGGGLIPVLLALYQFTQANALAILVVTAIVTIVSYYAARVVPGIGIQMNPLLAPLTAALSAMLFAAASHAAPVAFAGGVLGTLIGADLLHLQDIQAMSSGVLSIGGAGVFDGIGLCGLFALLLT